MHDIRSRPIARATRSFEDLANISNVGAPLDAHEASFLQDLWDESSVDAAWFWRATYGEEVSFQRFCRWPRWSTTNSAEGDHLERLVAEHGSGVFGSVNALGPVVGNLLLACA